MIHIDKDFGVRGNMKRLPLLHPPLLPTPHAIIRPIAPRHPANVPKAHPERHPSALLRLLRRPSDLRSHVCGHPAGTHCVDDEARVVAGEEVGDGVDAGFGEGVGAPSGAEAGLLFGGGLDGCLRESVSGIS